MSAVIRLLPGALDLNVYRGDDALFQVTMTEGGTPLILPTTGWSAQIRASISGSSPVLATFTIDAAAAEQAGIPNAASEVSANLGRLVAAPVNVGGPTSITEVHAYASDVRKTYLSDSRALPPGQNPGAVTDPILAAAIQAVLAPPQAV